jgi:hypothetical protein
MIILKTSRIFAEAFLGPIRLFSRTTRFTMKPRPGFDNLLAGFLIPSPLAPLTRVLARVSRPKCLFESECSAIYFPPAAGLASGFFLAWSEFRDGTRSGWGWLCLTAFILEGENAWSRRFYNGPR